MFWAFPPRFRFDKAFRAARRAGSGVIGELERLKREDAPAVRQFAVRSALAAFLERAKIFGSRTGTRNFRGELLARPRPTRKAAAGPNARFLRERDARNRELRASCPRKEPAKEGLPPARKPLDSASGFSRAAAFRMNRHFPAASFLTRKLATFFPGSEMPAPRAPGPPCGPEPASPEFRNVVQEAGRRARLPRKLPGNRPPRPPTPQAFQKRGAKL